MNFLTFPFLLQNMIVEEGILETYENLKWYCNGGCPLKGTNGHKTNRMYRRLLAKLAQSSIDLKNLKFVKLCLTGLNIKGDCSLVSGRIFSGTTDDWL